MIDKKAGNGRQKNGAALDFSDLTKCFMWLKPKDMLIKRLWIMKYSTPGGQVLREAALYGFIKLDVDHRIGTIMPLSPLLPRWCLQVYTHPLLKKSQFRSYF